MTYDCIIVGAGAAGLQCAGHLDLGTDARILVVDHAKRPAEKIRISGGGRCNFTNMDIEPKNFLSSNPHFCKSALKRYTQWDFIGQVAEAGIAYHEKTLGQLFCDDSAQQIIDMLVARARKAGAQLSASTRVYDVKASADGGFDLTLESNGEEWDVHTAALVVASGGLSIPKIGASAWGYDLARQFGHKIIETRPALVPLTFGGEMLEQSRALSGLSTQATIKVDNVQFDEGMLFTHRGLSGPSILQISSYWRHGQDVAINLAPGHQAGAALIERRQTSPKKLVRNILCEYLPSRLAESVCDELGMARSTLADASNKALHAVGQRVNNWRITPTGTEGYRTAEVTLGGVDTMDLNSRSMESQNQPGLYFIGEVVDVTGWLGGYNFQWAWSSGWAAAQDINRRDMADSGTAS